MPGVSSSNLSQSATQEGREEELETSPMARMRSPSSEPPQSSSTTLDAIATASDLPPSRHQWIHSEGSSHQDRAGARDEPVLAKPVGLSVVAPAAPNISVGVRGTGPVYPQARVQAISPGPTSRRHRVGP